MVTFSGKEKFVLIIGEDGAVLSYMSGKTLVNRLFSPTPDAKDCKEFTKLFRSHPKVPIYVLVDSIEQSYVRQVLPAVSSLSIGKLVRKRLERDYTETDIKGALYLERMEVGRRDWVYMFISTPMNEVLAMWMDFIFSLPNSFAGLFMLPLEMQNFASKLNQHLFPTDSPIRPSPWQLIVTHNKTGGFRQVVLHHEKVVFTRMIRAEKETKPAVIAGNVEQEVLNTVDYMRRLNFKDDEELDLIVVVSAEIKQSLLDVKLRGKEIITFTPHELSNKIGLKDVTSENDKFADLIVAAIFAQSKPILKFFTSKIKFLYILSVIYRSLHTVTVTVFPVLLLYSLMLGYQLYDSSKRVEDISGDKARIESKWKEAQKTDQYNVDDANKITDAVMLHSVFSKLGADPLTMLKSLNEIQQENATLMSLSWQARRLDVLKQENKKEYHPDIELRSIFNLRFYNTGENVESLFSNYDTFAKKLQDGFKHFTVEYSKLPDRISFGEQNKEIDIQVTLESTNSKDKK